MIELNEIQRQIVERIAAAPAGSWLRFKLMDAADAMSKAIEAETKTGPYGGDGGAGTVDVVVRTDAGAFTAHVEGRAPNVG